MPYRPLATAALLAAAALTSVLRGQDTKPDEAKRPAVFRCVLDKHARVIVVRLSPTLWAAYDAATCGLFKVWTGDIDLTGSVYDTKHGPQPQAKGNVLFKASGTPVWKLTVGEKDVKIEADYQGYVLAGDVPTFQYAIKSEGRDPIRVSERVTLYTENQSQLVLRSVTVKGLPADAVLSLSRDGAGEVREMLAKSQAGSELNQDGSTVRFSADTTSAFNHQFATPADGKGTKE